ncbi:MAG: SDR family oxidoreductase [Chloroflexota bacterium]
MDLAGKVAIVTGGGTGIGRAISSALGAAGVRVVVNYSRSQDDAFATVRELQGAGAEGIALRADVSKRAEIQTLVDETVGKFGRLDILVNNAGRTIFVPFQDLDNMDDDSWDDIMNLNVKGPFMASKVVAGPMRASGGGAIVNISSIAGIKAGGSCIAYAVSKAALIHLTKAMAIALAPDVRVNSVAPGLVRTRWGERFTEEQKARMESVAPLKRSVTPEEIATATLECVRNGGLTGQTIAVDTGLLLT